MAATVLAAVAVSAERARWDGDRVRDDELIAEAVRILRGEGIGLFATDEARRKALQILADAGLPPIVGDGVADDTEALRARADRRRVDSVSREFGYDEFDYYETGPGPDEQV